MTPAPAPALFDARAGRATAPDFTLPQPHERYTAVDHDTWARLYARQVGLLEGRVVDQFFDGLDRLAIGEGGIPDFAAINARLSPATGWSVVAVPGLVPDDVFFRHLAERRFPAGWWIRAPHEFDYIEEPDVFHDVFGHVPLLMVPAYADYVAAYGRAGLAALGSGRLDLLARLYWYTVEFALMRTPAGLRIFGAGIASSPGETTFALESRSPNRIAFDLERVMATRYRIDDYQETYFVLDGFDGLPALDPEALAASYARVAAGPGYAPGDVGPLDRILSRGDRSRVRAPHAA